ncbi:amino acid adenylation domain-containing protein [Lysinibacillus sp. NPDC056185]|uniref:amino acid adenylation domain-containing protein n=1 Tax=Lysinibacillus sp. NPDC056185 TaxID=3345739 RepID=UPI0039EF895A
MKEVKSDVINKSKSFWIEMLATEFDRLVFQKNQKGNESYFLKVDIDKEITNKIKQLTKDKNIMIYTLILTVFKIALSRMCSYSQFAIGIPPYIKDNKRQANNEFLLSKQLLTKELDFKKVLSNEKNVLFNSFLYEFYPLEQLYKRNFIYEKINVFCVMEELHSDLQIKNILNLPNNDLTLNIRVKEDSISLIFNSFDYVEENQIFILKDIFVNILQKVINNLTIRIDDIDIISEKEKSKLKDINSTSISFPKNLSLSEIFEKQVENNPDHIAIVFKNEKFSYKELNEKSNIIANKLKDNNVEKGDVVGLIAEKSPEMIIGILAILKAGAAYLPIDYKYPEERVKYMLEDSNCKILLKQGNSKDIVNLGCKIIKIDLKENEILNADNLNIPFEGNELAYIIYTSGSTGRPKGTLINQSCVISRLVGNTNYININKNDIFLQLSSYVFDGSIFEIFGSLLNGARLVIPEKYHTLDLKELGSLIEKEKISILFITTALFHSLVELNLKSLQNVKKILIGGEKLSLKHAKKAFDFLGPNRIINLYGPTESTIFATYYPINDIDEEDIFVPIGGPISNTKLYVIGNNNKLQPIGVPGELCISGEGLASGYINRNDLTEKKFVENPYETDDKMYKTGDLARWLPDGNIEFIERIDYQVKIRGYRIELGEIENALLKINEINEAVVLVKEIEDNKYIYAYYVANCNYSKDLIREKLKETLPSYMMPANFIKLEKIPLTINGKVDRLKLNKLEDESKLGIYEHPKNDIEEKLIQIWKDILKINYTISINDSFFDVGGHSLNAIKVVGRIHKELNIDIPIKDFFSLENIKNIASYISSVRKKEYRKIKKIQEKRYYEASSAQKRIYLTQEFETASNVYNITEAMEVIGKLNVSKITDGLKKIIKNNEILRTSFDVVDGIIVQKIHYFEEIDFKIERMQVVNEMDIDKKIREFSKPFLLQKAPLLRVGVISIDNKRHILIFDIHHIIADGTSINILLEQLASYVNEKDLIVNDIQYKDYSAWQKGFFNTKEIKKQEKYWLDVFKSELPILNLPSDYKRPSKFNFEGDSLTFEIDSFITNKLKKIAKENDSTLYMVLLAAYSTLLSKYTNQEDLIIGTPMSGRNHIDLQNLMGMFVNTVAIRNYPEANKTFKEFLKETKETVLKAIDNQDYQFDELIRKLEINRDTSRNALFDTMFVYQNLDEANFEFEELKIKKYNYIGKTSKFDLTLNITEEKNEMNCSFEYCTKIYKKETIELMSDCFSNLLYSIIENIDRKLKDINVLSQKEKDKINQFNNTSMIYDKNKPMHQLFEEQVKNTPDQIAVIYENNKVTYSQLNEKSNQLARILRDKGVKRDTVVGIFVNQSIEMVVGILAILKAGGAYLPIDPEYPEERIQYILEDSRVAIILTQGNINTGLLKEKETVNVADDKVYKNSIENLENVNEINDLAYIIYTSGSTGRPKGVMVEHKGLANLKSYFENEYNICEKDNIIQFANCTFDAAVWEMSMALLTGATLFIVPRYVINDVNAFEAFLNINRITVATLPPVYASNLSPHKINYLRLLITAGSESNSELVKKWNGKVQYVNAYGPTETTVCAAAWTDYRINKDNKTVPIGKPIYNTKIYILDKNQKIQPIGVHGELCIGGIGIARGYLNNLELTKQKFIPNPYIECEKIYRTGDIARWLPDGNIEYVGREDYQVKIRGYRIELEEIERRLLLNRHINEAVVVTIKDQHHEYNLACYVVADKKMILSEIRTFLLNELPEYMVPSYYMQLDSIPKNQSGKPDRRILKELKGDKYLKEGNYEKPSNEYECLLVEIWEEIFVHKKVGINDDFFHLGGDSIKAIKCIYKLNEKNLTLKLSDIFKYRTIKKIVEVINSLERNSLLIEPTVGKFKLTPIQKWFFESHKIEPEYFHQATFLKCNEKINVDVLRDILKEVQMHHDSLRMGFTTVNDEVVGEILGSNYPFNYEVVYLDNLEQDKSIFLKKVKELQKNVDLKLGPMMSTVVFKTNNFDYIYILIHHLAVDTVSWGILINDIQSLYKQFLRKKDIKLTNKSNSIKEWSKKLYYFSNSEAFLKEKSYWRNIQRKINSVPFDFSHDTNTMRDSDTYEISLNLEETEALLEKCSELYKTSVVNILLSALSFVLQNWTGSKENAIMFEGHGREDLFNDVSIQRTVGWFTSIYPIILEAPATNNLIDYLDRTILIRNAIPRNGIGYHILKYLTEEENKKDIDRFMTPQICFNYHGETDLENKGRIFEIIEEEHGSNISINSERHFELEFNGNISNGKLKILLTFNTKAYKSDTIANLAKKYKEILLEFISLNKKQLNIASLENNLSFFLNKYKAPGLILGIKAPDGQNTVISKGLADIKNNINMKSTTNFKIGSITKTFVATIILQLMEERLLNLDDSVIHFLPELLEQYKADYFNNITIKSLLNHTSGIHDFVKHPSFIKGLESNREWTKEELLYYGLSLPYDQTFNNNIWIYSSTGYILLGLIIEKITHVSLEENIQNRICNKLGLEQTRLVDELPNLYNFSRCYTNPEKKDVTNNALSASWASGGMISNASDLLIWLDAFVDGVLLKNKDIINDYIDISMNYPTDYKVNMGLGIFNVNDMLGHEGHGLGFQNILYKYNGYSFVIHLNQEAADKSNVISEPFKIFNELITLLR